jgi:hypothetical protein
MGGIDCVDVTVCGVCSVLQCTGIRRRNKIAVGWGGGDGG